MSRSAPSSPCGRAAGGGVARPLMLNRRQRERLDWIIARNGPARPWDGRAALADATRAVIVTEPPNGPAIEAFLHALAPDAIVVIPFGENPAFDALKAKLVDFGTVGAAGAEGPHQMWWGGLGWHCFVAPPTTGDLPRVVVRDSGPVRHPRVERLISATEAFGLAVDIADAHTPLGRGSAAMIELVADAWRRSDAPILWVDAGAAIRRLPMLPTATGCDFAVHRWRRWELSPATLYFGRTPAAAALLRTWRTLARLYPDVWEGQLLDQAWGLVSSQVPLDTVWLPPAYHAAADADRPGDTTVIVHAFAAATQDFAPWADTPGRLRAARRAGRTGAPEAQLVMAAPSGGDSVVTVMLRDVARASADATAAAVEAAAQAFAADPGGFSQLELALCCWDEDVAAVRTAADGGRVLHTTPQVRLVPDSFGALRRSHARLDDLGGAADDRAAKLVRLPARPTAPL